MFQFGLNQYSFSKLSPPFVFSISEVKLMLYIVHFGPYRPYSFVPSNASQLLSLTPQNAYNMLATSATNKASYQTLTR